MPIFEPARAPYPARMLSVLRIVAGLIFLSAGAMKLFGFPPPPVGVPPMAGVPGWEMQLAGALETFGGAAIVLGLLTRPIAFLLAGEMAVAFFQVHFPISVFPTTNGGVAPVLFCFIFLYLVSAGPGEWSLDALLSRARRLRTLRMNPARRPSGGLVGLHYDL
ncbi:MAG TPA: DoxX family protein [Gemmatimonadales bacterium]|nr:DoxX family protein [Gemmatimonadales bacterium]